MGLPLESPRDVLESSGKSVGLSSEMVDRFEGALIAKIIFGVECEQALRKHEGDSGKAADSIENVSALPKAGRMEEGKFRGPQRIADQLLLQTWRIRFNPAFEL